VLILKELQVIHNRGFSALGAGVVESTADKAAAGLLHYSKKITILPNDNVNEHLKQSQEQFFNKITNPCITPRYMQRERV
jgi:hypothetical protein